MDVSHYLSAASFWTPDDAFERHTRPEMCPIVYWLVDALRPRRLVQIGLREPSAYIAMCEAALRLDLDAQGLAVDLGATGSSALAESSFRRFREWHGRTLASFSRIVRTDREKLLETLPDQSVDILHVTDPSALDLFLADPDRWRPKFSDRGVLMLSRTGVDGSAFGSLSAFRDLSARRPAFEFTHGDGLGLVGFGNAFPDTIRLLFEADGSPSRRNEIRAVYARLGRSLADRRPAELVVRALTASTGDDLESEPVPLRTHSHASAHRRGESWDSMELEEGLALREELELLREEFQALDERHRATATEHEALGRENPWLRHQLAHYQHHHAAAMSQLEEVRGSTALKVLERCRRARRKLFPETRLHGRCVTLSLRFARVIATQGPKPALSRATRRVLRKLGKAVGVKPFVAPLPAATTSSDVTDRFERLPWILPEETPEARTRVHYRILLVSHSACRTGAPLCLLRLCEELSRIPGIECHVVLRTGGDLEREFSRLAPTLLLSKVVEAGLASWETAPALIAESFREHARRGIAVCNTMAVSEFHAAFQAAEVPVLSWIHELPTFIDILGGALAIDRIKAASRRTIVPAHVVRDELINRFDVDPTRIQTVRYGLEAKTRGLSRDESRAAVLDELELPADAKIVLGCGTIDLRKGADLFVQAARRVLAESPTSDKTWFIWFGNVVDAGLARWLAHDIEASGFEDRIRFAGVRSDLSRYFLAADVFALTSREDPCPFANLEAMESGLPIVAFQGSGGAPEVLDGGGVAVPYLDVAAMSRSIAELLGDESARKEMGSRGRTAIHRTFTWPRFMGEFLEILRSDYDYRPIETPKVSVIVPNYRHAPFLEARLRSVFEQTVKPHEIIFLDDASPDDSVDVARRLLGESSVPMRIVVNEENSGSTFRQWLKGMELASGDLVWLAESDDCCDPRFLERLIPEFDDPEVVLAYCQSRLIGPNDEPWASDFLDHTDDLDPKRWRGRYTAAAADEAELALSQKNTVPNASAVLFRKPAELDFAEELMGMRFAGDWLFYAMMIRDAKIAFVPESLNAYRRHEQTVSFQSVKADTHAQETLHVKSRIFETFDVSANAMARSLGQTLYEYELMSERFALKRPALTANSRAAGPLSRIKDRFRSKTEAPGGLNILLVLDGSDDGLVTTATIDLANAMAEEHRVFVACARPSERAAILEERFDPRVVFLEGTLGGTPWAAGPVDDGMAVGRVRATVLEELVRIHEIDVIHTRDGSADALIAQIIPRLDVPWFVHHREAGPSWTSLALAKSSRAASATEMISGVFHDSIEPPSPSEEWDALASRRWISLPPGVRPNQGQASRERRLIRRGGEFLVYLIEGGPAAAEARRNAMTAVRVVNRMHASERGGRRARLVLLDPNTPHVRDHEAATILADCDVALAPGEAVAPGVAETIALATCFHVPVIAPDRGAVHELLSVRGLAAGVAREPNDKGVLDVDRIASAVLRYLRDPLLQADHAHRARALFDARFRVERTAAACVEAYLHARDFLVFRGEARRPGPTNPSALESRESA